MALTKKILASKGRSLANNELLEAERNLLVDFRGEVHIWCADFLANFRANAAHTRFNFINDDNDVAVVHLGFKRVIDGVFGGQRAIMLQHLAGGAENLEDRPLVAAFNRILHQGWTDAHLTGWGAVATNQKGGKNQQGRKKGNIFSHSQLCNQITRTRQARIRGVSSGAFAMQGQA